jgi:hypothetical protein
MPNRIVRGAAPAQPIMTPGPTYLPKPKPRAAIAKRDIPFPPYLSDLSYVYSSVYVTPACSCLITSALPPVLSKRLLQGLAGLLP